MSMCEKLMFLVMNLAGVSPFFVKIFVNVDRQG